METIEKWMPVSGYENRYEVSNCGRVRSLNYNNTGKTEVMKAEKNKYGYLQIQLCKDGKVKRHLVHRLVWEAFNGKIPEGLVINHLDERKDNNWLENLEVCTIKENNNYGSHNERVAKAMIGKFGNHPSTSKAVNQIDKLTGKVLNTYPSTREAERQTGISNSTIAKCCLGKPHYNSAGGFKWSYAN